MCSQRLQSAYTEAGKQSASPEGLAQVLETIGAGEETRTPDLRITNALLYQLSYTGQGRAS
jgi:hypothetical protein